MAGPPRQRLAVRGAASQVIVRSRKRTASKKGWRTSYELDGFRSLLDALQQIAVEKGIAADTLFDALANALAAAYKRLPPGCRRGRRND